MKLTRYHVYVEDYPEPGRHLLFNTRSQGLVEVEDSLRSALDELPAPPRLRSHRRAIRRLRRLGFIVDNDGRDDELIEEYFADISAGSGAFRAVVLTTFACNFACTYCVEEGVTSNLRMSDETAEQTARFIVDRSARDGCDSVYLSFYGGEPLMHRRPISVIAPVVRAHCERKGMRHGMSMTTNGALLTPPVLDELTALGLEGVRITVDGDREHHDAKRPFKDGRGSFDVIMQNLAYAVDRIQVDLGGNFDDENLGSIPKLLTYLEESGLAKKLHNVSFKPISRTPEQRKSVGAGREMDCAYADPRTAAQMAWIRREITSRGLPTAPGIGVNVCSALTDSREYTIDPEGRLFRCVGLVGHNEFAVGDIRRGEHGFEHERELWRRCSTCAYVPLCGDGCMFGSYLRYGDLTRLNCRREYVEYLVRENLKTQYLLGHTGLPGE
jgi:uncharacterized protein